MILNPSKKSLNLESLKTKALNSTPLEKCRKEVPGSKDKFSEEFFIPLEIQTGPKTQIKLCTYREHGKNIQNFEKPRAILFFSHGLFAHENRYGHVPKFFSNLGVTVVGFDSRGHGKSSGLPGYIEDFDANIKDFELFMKIIDSIYAEDIPRFFMGQSMGGMLGFLIGLKNSNYFKGMILFAPSLKQHSSKKFIMSTAKLLSYLISTIPIPTKRKNDSSKNPAVFEDSMQDPYVYKGGMRMGTIRSLVNAMNISNISLEKFKVPFVMIQGGMDTLVDVECNIDLFEVSPAKDKTLVFYENVWHDILHEEEVFEILEFVGKWVEERINSPKKEKQEEDEEIKSNL